MDFSNRRDGDLLTQKEWEKIKRERKQGRKKRRETKDWEPVEDETEENPTGDIFITLFIVGGFLVIALNNITKWGHV